MTEEQTPKFDMYDVNSEESMRYMYDYFKPGGSGPKSMMMVIRRLIERIAEDKGYDLENLNEKTN